MWPSLIFGVNTRFTVGVWENTYQKNINIWTFFMRWKVTVWNLINRYFNMVFQEVVSWVQHSVVLGVLCCQKLSNRIRTFSLKTNSSLKPTRISTRSFFAKIVNYFPKKSSIVHIWQKSIIADIRLRSKNASGRY